MYVFNIFHFIFHVFLFLISLSCYPTPSSPPSPSARRWEGPPLVPPRLPLARETGELPPQPSRGEGARPTVDAPSALAG